MGWSGTLIHANPRTAIEACRSGAGVHGAIATRVGGDRSAGDRPWWHRAGRARHWDIALHDPARGGGRAGGPARRAGGGERRGGGVGGGGGGGGGGRPVFTFSVVAELLHE